jgi:hypothetical protein
MASAIGATVDDHLGAFARQGRGDGQADARRGTGDQA